MQIKNTLALLFAAATLASCSSNKKDNPIPVVPTEKGTYILTVSPTASTGVADYLLTTADLDTGTTTIIGNGVEQDGTYRYYVTHNNKFFSMLYGQGNPGAVTAYSVENGKLKKLTNFQSETVQAFAPVKDDILMFKISRNAASPNSSWYKVSTNSLTLVGEGVVNTLELTGLGELAHFTWLKQVGEKVFAPYQTIIDRSFNTAYPDKAFIAIFNYDNMQLEKVITDDRASFIGSYFRDGLSVQENGDVYGFSPSAATTDNKLSSTKPSAVLRIKAGTTEFDQSYYFDVEAASGGMNITGWMYVGNNTYIVQSEAKVEKTSFPAGLRVGIVNVVDKTYKAVTGFPAVGDIANITTNNYTPKDGKIGYLGVNLKNGNSYVYKIDASTASATRGLKVEGGVITAIQNLK
ncbi:hypothetical protein DJ568_15005 [Mucilaginibacter hurinus]|uniref:DUF4374 domain-containing protein n=1 Tax=Mucilaginibacter hurinus TaxID=2201324 RepID=A0A367GK44_9SPHI|nr:DUF4374 domain-containing protein [Mucilaginibacter hurinus]RCH53847.1 hypothetical protein DJ568_15005 [Mucilaginibacter hurinus]